MNDAATPSVSTHAVVRNTLYNLLGFTIPFLVSLIAFPPLIAALGTERMGVILLAWSIVGYFNLFDIGISRTTTKYVAEHIAAGRREALPPLIWSSLGMLFLLGLTAMAAWFACIPWLAGELLRIPAALLPETRDAFALLALSIPMLMLTAGIRGVFEGEQRFGLINLIKVPASIANYLLPLAVTPFTVRLDVIVLVLVCGRLAVLLVHAACLFAGDRRLLRPSFLPGRELGKLLAYGGWMTVSRIISPVMVYLDRFFIGAMLGLVAVTYYTTPFELVGRLLILSQSFIAVLFPAMSALARDDARLARVSAATVRATLLVFIPLTVLTVAGAKPFLSLWIDVSFGGESALVLQILAVGLLLNALAQIPFTTIQARGRTDVTAWVHLAELPLYIGGLILCLHLFGIAGAALAWTGRMVLDVVLLFYLEARLNPSGDLRESRLPAGLAIASAACAAAWFLGGLDNLILLAVAACALALAAAAAVWFFLLDVHDRGRAREVLAGLKFW